MTERRGSEPPRKRGGDPGRDNPRRANPPRRPSATDSTRSSTPRSGRAGPPPDKEGRKPVGGTRKATGEPRKSASRPAEPRKAAGRAADPRKSAGRSGEPRLRKAGPADAPRAKRAAGDPPRRTAKKAVADASRRTAKKAAAARPVKAASGAPRRTGEPTRKRTSSGSSGSGPRKRPPQNRRPPRKPKVKKPPRTLKLGRPTLRLRLTFGVMAFVLSLFAGRLILLQGVDPDSYALAATKENTKPFELHAPRGDIVDRAGVPLAASEEAVAITADPMQTGPVAAQLATILAAKLPGTTYARFHSELTLKKRYVLLANKVSPPTWNEIEQEIKKQNVAINAQNKGKPKDAKAPLLAGLFTESDPIRSHPLGTVAAGVVGAVGKDGKGLAGLEYGLNDKLSGTDGKAMYEVDAKGNKIPNADHTVQEPKPGVGVQLTLDSDLQWVAEKRIQEAVKYWKAESGSVVTMDVKSGEILAMANYPTYDPNKALKPSEMKNPALDRVYEPGSVQKVVTMAALADAGLITLDTQLVVPGTLNVQRHRIKDHYPHGDEKLTISGVIAKSSNVGTILAAQQLPTAEFVHYLKDFGFGEPTGLKFPGETRGLMPPGDEWDELTKATVSFGQGLGANAVQMTAAVNAVANGGVYVPPKLVKNYVDADGNEIPNPASSPPRRVVSEEAAKMVGTMMESVTSDGGTALQAAIAGYRVAGKTGTAQQTDPSCGVKYCKWATSFAGFAPADNPRFVTYVVLHNPANGRGGGFQGGPVFRDVMSFALQKYAVPPTGAKQPRTPLTW